METRLRQLPAVHQVLDQPALADSIFELGRPWVKKAIQQTLDAARLRLLKGDIDLPTDIEAIALLCLDALKPVPRQLRAVINATGVLLNTGLGRAPLADSAVEAINEVARGYCNLEFDLATGERGTRTSGVESLLMQLTGAEAATVVNNNAGATILGLRALAFGREVIVSRGQLVEIGGSFRLPEIFEVSGARLREVGTTNKTKLADYERAIGPDTAALLRVHASNYKICGFTEQTKIEDLAKLAKSRGLWSIDDIGSGAIDADHTAGMDDEPTVQSGLAAGADLVLFSGDKLLGGPQAGILVGTRSALKRIQSDPLMRALRVDKLTLAALEATLLLLLSGQKTPLMAFLSGDIDHLRSRAESLAESLRKLGWRASATPSEATVGGGSVPGSALPSWSVKIEGEETPLATALRNGSPSIVGRVHEGAVWLDLKAVFEHEDSQVHEALTQIQHARAGRPD